MVLPDYTKNNLINLLSSLIAGCGGKNPYPLLDPRLTEEIKNTKNVILFIIDGLGADSVQRLGKKSFLFQQQDSTLTTVFPSTTAAAITATYTGKTPQEHGAVAWYMNLKEFGAVVALLPFVTRQKQPLHLLKERPLYFPPSIFTQISRPSHIVLRKKLLQSTYNQFFITKKVKQWSYTNLRGLFSSLRKAITSNQRKKYIYAYWGGFDDYSHKLGKHHHKTQHHLQEIETRLAQLVKKVQGTDTLILITADHGQIVTTKKTRIILNNHPKLKECLSLPVCGESRAAFCYVYPHKTQQFENYVTHKLKEYCTLYRAADLAAHNWFGLGEEHPRFRDRIGDYILIAKGNYVLRDFLINEEPNQNIGFHGGISEEEMLIPLIKIKV